MDNKEIFNTVINLVARQPWVGAKVAELSHILYEECKCANSREMLINIINNFSYMSRQDYSEKLGALADEIMSEEGYEDNAQIVAMAADSGPDSSQEITYNLKFTFTQKGWLNFSGVSTFGSAYKNYNKTGRKKLYVVDDFVGSGQTVISRYKELCRVFTHGNVDGYSISFKVLVSTEHGLEAVRDAGIDISAQTIIKKAIDGFFPDAIAAEYRTLMTRLETGLSLEHEGIMMPSLGYNGAQAAYCREASNTPNSVLPIFWWPFDHADERRPTMLHRAMRDA
ncbi:MULTISPECIES: phosphoribosyltransferase-like protein [Pseudomonas syringae group]|uniref:PRTase-CE domain-containing protein n=1 Tax=Pseudomonas syringae pv. japonica str. M301072 TaxID=629262 RepID=F3FHA3_PSESX|nr:MULTISPECIES: hypothetical protein [Pseudomonas syringae group]EGH29589.1 hypothetical protein PSYJA_11645 [Pseudomonas syringae pv. japonica str. M301072]KPX34370.1 Uncharacterized protein ALO77_01940 [Pseudomonas coronafaciens pv. garcae]RMV84489.1 hypothetical protein ALP02_02594 [Pseudomonas coronafaciens pv. garcae]